MLLLSGLAVQFAAGLEETPRTSKFEPERKNRFRNGGRTRTPKHRTSSMATTFGGGETQRPRFGQLYPSHNSFNAKPSQPLSGNGLIEAGDFASSLSGLGGLQSTQLPPHSGTNPQRNSEFLKGKSKIILRKILSKYLPTQHRRVGRRWRTRWLAVCTNRSVCKWELILFTLCDRTSGIGKSTHKTSALVFPPESQQASTASTIYTV